MAQSKAKAVRIAYLENNRIRFEIDSFCELLEKIGDRPISIVSINGPMRTGKSYMLGHFLRYLYAKGRPGWFSKTLGSEFLWKHSADRITTGILIWSEPFFVRKNGREVAIVLMDTQGVFDDQTSSTENSYLFAISCLLSSVLIYNVTKQISEDVLQFLEFFLGYAKMPFCEDEAKPISNLIFLVRDWQFKKDFGCGYYDDKVSASARNYKKEKLDPNSNMAEEARNVHRAVVSSFETVGCCLMPHPGKSFAEDGEADVGRLDPEFVDTVKNFVGHIFAEDSITIKKIGTKEITGKDFKRIIKRWVEVFKTAEIPPAKTVSEATAEAQYTTAMSSAFKFYENEMREKTGLSEKKLQELHSEIMRTAIGIFEKKKGIENPTMKQKFSKILKKKIEYAFQSYQQINRLRLELEKTQSGTHSESLAERKWLFEKIVELERKQAFEQANQLGKMLLGVAAAGATVLFPEFAIPIFTLYSSYLAQQPGQPELQESLNSATARLALKDK